jgi:hypothetical protein
MFVRGGHTKLSPSRFTKVRAKVKQFDRPAYIYVPTPSNREDPGGDGPSDGGTPPPKPGPTGGMAFGNVSVSGDNTQNAFGNQIGGDFRQERS